MPTHFKTWGTTPTLLAKAEFKAWKQKMFSITRGLSVLKACPAPPPLYDRRWKLATLPLCKEHVYNLYMTNSYSTLLQWACYENTIDCAKINVSNINNRDEANFELIDSWWKVCQLLLRNEKHNWKRSTEPRHVGLVSIVYSLELG